MSKLNDINLTLDLAYVNDDKYRAPLRFIQNRNAPILKNPELYYFTISKFQIGVNNSLPVWIPQIEIGQSNVDKTIYTITMEYKDILTPILTATSTLYYIPTDKTVQVRDPLISQDLSNDYYYAKTYTIFELMINNAFIDCNNQIEALYSGVYPLKDKPPFISFEPASALFYLYYPQIVLPQEIKLYTNSVLIVLISSFPYIFYGVDQPMNKDAEFILNKSFSFNRNLTDYDHMSQNTVSISAMNPIKSLAFTSNLLPISQTLTAPPIINGRQSDIAAVANVIADYVVDVGLNSGYTQTITYVSHGEYKFLDFKTNEEIYNIDISLSWIDVNGLAHPVYLFKPSFAAMTIYLRRKDYNNITLLK